jgi:hypothetical protein
LDQARRLLSLINQNHLKKVYAHRAARIILIKQEEILRRMVAEGNRFCALVYKLQYFVLIFLFCLLISWFPGTLSDDMARTLFRTLADESNVVNQERATHDMYDSFVTMHICQNGLGLMRFLTLIVLF